MLPWLWLSCGSPWLALRPKRWPRRISLKIPTIGTPQPWPLVLDAGIWTHDRDFLGCGIATWTTTTLQAHLSREAEGSEVG